MSFVNVALYAGLIIFIVSKRIQGRPICTAKQLFLLPVIVTILGVEDFSHPSLDGIDIGVGIVGCALSLALGALRGTKVKISSRDGTPWVQWGAAAVAIFAVNVAAKLALDGAGVAIGGSTSGVTASLVLAAGLMLAGEAAVVWIRLQIGGPSRLDGNLVAAGRRVGAGDSLVRGPRSLGPPGRATRSATMKKCR
jgi:hypothetical protein